MNLHGNVTNDAQEIVISRDNRVQDHKDLDLSTKRIDVCDVVKSPTFPDPDAEYVVVGKSSSQILESGTHFTARKLTNNSFDSHSEIIDFWISGLIPNALSTQRNLITVTRIMSLNCPCGLPLHYSSSEYQEYIQGLIKEHGEYIAVGGYSVPRHYAALHMIEIEDLEALAEQYKWEKINE